MTIRVGHNCLLDETNLKLIHKENVLVELEVPIVGHNTFSLAPTTRGI